MEAIIDLLQAVHISMLEVILVVLLAFGIGYRIAMKKVKKLTEEIYSLQRDVLDLNAELLTGTQEPKTPVIGIKHDSIKNGKLANFSS
jgi:hypothetical protein